MQTYIPINKFGAHPGPVISLGAPLYFIHLININRTRYTNMNVMKTICGINSKNMLIVLLKYLLINKIHF